MPNLLTALYLLAAGLAAGPALFELRLIARFLVHRGRIRDAVRGRDDAAVPPAGEAPTVTIQIPLYNERTAAEQIILAAAAQDYPLDRMDIQVLDDSTDETADIVAQLVGSLRAAGVRIEHVRRERRVGFKAGALAHGLERSQAEFVAIFDADFTPDPTFLERTLLRGRAFGDPDVAFVQARWAWSGAQTGIFHSAVALLMDRHFFIQKPTRAFMGNVTVFNGSAGIWRRAAIDDVGGWSSDTLTEDLDLSYRCALGGWKGRYLRDVTVSSELPGNMRAFKLQQHRWARGNAQCMRKLTGRVLNSPGVIHERWEEAQYLAGYVVHPILLANLLLWPWAVLSVDRRLFLVLQLFLAAFNLVAPLSFLLVLKERGDRITGASVLRVVAGMCLGIGLMIANTVGQVQGFLSHHGEFTRTPKAPRAGRGADAASRRYRSALHWTFFLELITIAYCAVGLDLLVERGQALWAFPMLFWGACLMLVVVLQWLDTETSVPSPALP